jgi:hypothetical protein
MTTTTDSVTLTADSTWIVRQRTTLYNARNQPTGAVLYSESRISNDTTYLAINRISNNSGARVRTWGTLVALPPTITPSTTFANQSLDCTVRYAGMTFNATTNINDISLQKIYAILFDKRISKSQRLSNWEAPQLTKAQCDYAALDAWACLEIYLYLTSGEFNPETSKYLREIQDPIINNNNETN